MYKLRLAAIAAFSIIISACSSVPEISDIEPGIREIWESCKIVEVKNLKKTNGIAKGERYQLDYSYDVQFKSDLFFADSERWFEDACPIGSVKLSTQLKYLIAASRKSDGVKSKAGDIFAKKGTEYTFTGSILMVKSEKGWIID